MESVNRQGARTIRLTEHDENVIKYYLPRNEIVADIADFFSVFSDATRVKILSSLCISEMCVTDLSVMLDQPQSTVSHQLAFLRALRLVKTRRVGKIIHYSLASPYVESVLDLGSKFLGY